MAGPCAPSATPASTCWRCQIAALRQQWNVAAELILEQANVPAVSRQVELALFYEAKLDIAAMEATSEPIR